MELQLQQTGQSQKEHFSGFLKELVQKFCPEQIYCFGRTVELKTADSCFTDQVRDEKFCYFLLMVTESITRIEHEYRTLPINIIHLGQSPYWYMAGKP